MAASESKANSTSVVPARPSIGGPQCKAFKHHSIGFKKPGSGVDPAHIENVIGKTVKKAVKAYDLLSMDDLI